TGHWLNLKHIWGDEYCGDDNVMDTPPQGWYTTGCPTGTRISCANGPSGDMYMNYMDFTSDACVNLFTEGQKERMHALFAPGGPRQSILQSTGLLPPLIVEAPLPEEVPRWLYPQLFPNPARDNAILDLSYDPRWIGKNISIINMQGQVLMQVQVTSKVQSINVSLLKPGLYLLSGKKEDGETVKLRFVKI
ncbi:MAG TPA: T9SS type A sorting domain-containing protein, partial [Chitinophagaceae bacterium]|nr:T9SS type A sorting domain-containing protein [Chitinophagaceae bacterium]